MCFPPEPTRWLKPFESPIRETNTAYSARKEIKERSPGRNILILQVPSWIDHFCHPFFHSYIRTSENCWRKITAPPWICAMTESWSPKSPGHFFESVHQVRKLFPFLQWLFQIFSITFRSFTFLPSCSLLANNFDSYLTKKILTIRHKLPEFPAYTLTNRLISATL